MDRRILLHSIYQQFEINIFNLQLNYSEKSLNFLK
jgi:hypothetical protein